MNVPPTATAGDADRILLVDDDPTNISILRNTLDGHGYKLMAATSGEDALRVALRARPALVLLDVLMPGIDGYETCRRLKGDLPQLMPPSSSSPRSRTRAKRCEASRPGPWTSSPSPSSRKRSSPASTRT